MGQEGEEMFKPLICDYCGAPWDTWGGFVVHMRTCRTRRALQRELNPFLPPEETK